MIRADSQFTLSALSQLEGVGIPVITSLNTNAQPLCEVLSTLISNVPSSNDTAVLNAWLVYGVHVFSPFPPTWRNLLLVICRLSLDDLAKQIINYLSETIDQEELHSALPEDMSISEGESGGDSLI